MATLEDVIEVPVSEYEALLSFGTKLAEQNALVLRQDAENQAAIKTLTDEVSRLVSAMRDFLQDVQVVVNVPEQPATKSRRYNVIRERGVIVGLEEAEHE